MKLVQKINLYSTTQVEVCPTGCEGKSIDGPETYRVAAEPRVYGGVNKMAITLDERLQGRITATKVNGALGLRFGVRILKMKCVNYLLATW